MSDFDDVLERLLSDPAFKGRLAADPASALAGYRLTADELELLQAQVGDAGGGQSRVEQRTSKASVFGLFSSIGAGIGDVVHGQEHGHGLGDAMAGSGQHVEQGLDQPGGGRHAALEPQDDRPAGLSGHVSGVEHSQGRHSAGLGVHAEAGPGGAYASTGSGGFAAAQPDDARYGYGQSGLAESHQDHGSSRVTESSGTVYRSSTYVAGGGPTPLPPQLGESHGLAGHGGDAGLGEAAGGGASHAGFGAAGSGGASHAGLGEAGADGQGGGGRHGLGGLLDQGRPGGDAERHGMGDLVGRGVHPQAPTDGYQTRVDWDGDGRWDQHTYVNRADGGVDIVVDTDGDGRAEFVGHDTDRDGLINSSEIDTNHDGVMDARYEDVNGDGWLDRRTR